MKGHCAGIMEYLPKVSVSTLKYLRGVYSDGGKACVISKVEDPYNTLIALDWLAEAFIMCSVTTIDVLRGEIAHLKHS